jgi:EmrB/QacA subfamily drug resistance transporter
MHPEQSPCALPGGWLQRRVGLDNLRLMAVCSGIFMGTVDSSIVNIALPTLQRAFACSFAAIQWVSLAYTLLITAIIPGVGRLGDMWGKKALLKQGFIVFTLASVACGLSPSLAWLLAARVAQGFGAAVISALGPAIITESFADHQRGKALGIVGSVVSIGVVVGPTLGGLLLSVAAWNWIFLLNLPFGLAGAWMVERYLADDATVRPANVPCPASQRFDFSGALTFFFGLGSLLLGLTVGRQVGLHPWQSLTLAGMGVCLLVLFVWLQKRAVAPLLDLSLFSDLPFCTSLTASFLTFTAVSGTLLLMPFYLQQTLGFSSRQTGLLLAINPALITLIAPLAGTMSDRFGANAISRLGLGLVLMGYVALCSLSEDTSTAGYIGRFLLLGCGMGLFQSPNNSAIMGAAPPERVGVASGLMAVSRTLGQATGVGLMGSLWAARVLHHGAQGARHAAAAGAEAAAQVAGLRDTMLSMALLICLALGLNIVSGPRLRRRPGFDPQ